MIIEKEKPGQFVNFEFTTHDHNNRYFLCLNRINNVEIIEKPHCTWVLNQTLSPEPFHYFITDKFHWFILLKYQEIWQNHIIILTLLSTESQYPFKVEFQYCQSAFQTITDQQYPGFHNVA